MIRPVSNSFRCYAVYYGNSMRGVFVPGDHLILTPGTFEKLRPGDVVAVKKRERPFVHRVVALMPDGAITMGDNNEFPDFRRLHPDDHWMLVRIAVAADGTLRKIAGGTVGMQLFHWHQWQRRMRTTLGRLWRRIEPFACWRLTAREDGVFRNGVCFRCMKIFVGSRSADGRIRYVGPLQRLCFRIPAAPRDEDRSSHE